MKLSLKIGLISIIAIVLIFGWYVYSIRNLGSHFAGGKTYYFSQSQDKVIADLQEIKAKGYHSIDSNFCIYQKLTDSYSRQTPGKFNMFFKDSIDEKEVVHYCFVYTPWDEKGTELVYTGIYYDNCEYQSIEHDIDSNKRVLLAEKFEELVIGKMGN